MKNSLFTSDCCACTTFHRALWKLNSKQLVFGSRSRFCVMKRPRKREWMTKCRWWSACRDSEARVHCILKLGSLRLEPSFILIERLVKFYLIRDLNFWKFFYELVVFEQEKVSFSILVSFNVRVWSWLRTNAGGMLNTCKSYVKFLREE